MTPAPHPIADAPEDPEADAFEAAASRPPTVRTVYVMAKLYVVQGKDIEAENLFKQVIKETPKSCRPTATSPSCSSAAAGSTTRNAR